MGNDRPRMAGRSGIEDYGSLEGDDKSVLDQVDFYVGYTCRRSLSFAPHDVVALSALRGRKVSFQLLGEPSLKLWRDNSSDSGRHIASIAKRSFDDDASVLQARMR